MTRFLTTAELADVLRVSVRTIQRMLADGSFAPELHYVRVRRQIRFREAAVEATKEKTRKPRRAAVSDALLAQLE